MVKNFKGGNHKNQARKDSYSNHSNLTRLSQDPCEIYAKVTKLFGGKICQVITIDGITLSCTIRGKFSGKFKHSNLLSINSFVLIGIHDWASDKLLSDLLHIYQSHDLLSLSSIHPIFFLLSFDNSISFISSIDDHSPTILDHILDPILDINAI